MDRLMTLEISLSPSWPLLSSHCVCMCVYLVTVIAALFLYPQNCLLALLFLFTAFLCLIISQADLLGDHKEDSLLGFSFFLLSQCIPLSKGPYFTFTYHLQPWELHKSLAPGSPQGHQEVIIYSQPYTYTSLHPTPNTYLQRCTCIHMEGTHRRAQRHVCLDRGICMWRQKGHKLEARYLHSKIPVSKKINKGGGGLEAHTWAHPKTWHTDEHSPAHIPHKCPYVHIQHSFNLQGWSAGREETQRALFLGGESEATAACYKGI